MLSISGDAAGDLLWYWIGRWARKIGIKNIDTIENTRNFISKNIVFWTTNIGKRIRRKLHALENHSIVKYVERHIKKHFLLALLIVKFTPPLSIPGQFSFGFLKVSFWKFLLQTTLVCFLFIILLVTIGFKRGGYS